jgi:hypothetical protein
MRSIAAWTDAPRLACMTVMAVMTEARQQVTTAATVT